MLDLCTLRCHDSLRYRRSMFSSTCCSVTAVHLELATDLSIDVFIRCLRRFEARRGLPELLSQTMPKRLRLQIKF